MDLQCILCIVNSSYAIKTPKDEGYFVFWCFNCDIYWNFYKKFKFGHVFVKTGDVEIKRGDGRQPLKKEVSHSKWEG